MITWLNFFENSLLIRFELTKVDQKWVFRLLSQFGIHLFILFRVELLNPYRQIPETISKKRAVTQGISRKLFPDFFQILQFWGVTQGIFRKLFPGKFHEYLPMKKYFFPKTGHDSEAFPETFSNIRKKFPEILLGHYPNLRNFKFHLKS